MRPLAHALNPVGKPVYKRKRWQGETMTVCPSGSGQRQAERSLHVAARQKAFRAFAGVAGLGLLWSQVFVCPSYKEVIIRGAGLVLVSGFFCPSYKEVTIRGVLPVGLLHKALWMTRK